MPVNALETANKTIYLILFEHQHYIVPLFVFQVIGLMKLTCTSLMKMNIIYPAPPTPVLPPTPALPPTPILLLLLSSSLFREAKGGPRESRGLRGQREPAGLREPWGAEGAEGARDPPSKLHLLKEYHVKKCQCTPQTTAC